MTLNTLLKSISCCLKKSHRGKPPRGNYDDPLLAANLIIKYLYFLPNQRVVKKILLLVIANFILVALYMVSGAHVSAIHDRVYFGDADATGGDDDANARFNYELMMLRDPATGRIPDN